MDAENITDLMENFKFMHYIADECHKNKLQWCGGLSKKLGLSS